MLCRVCAVGLRKRARREQARQRHHQSALAGGYRVNGVVSNMPEFAPAFGCKVGHAMVREKPCRVW